MRRVQCHLRWRRLPGAGRVADACAIAQVGGAAAGGSDAARGAGGDKDLVDTVVQVPSAPPTPRPAFALPNGGRGEGTYPGAQLPSCPGASKFQCDIECFSCFVSSTTI